VSAVKRFLAASSFDRVEAVEPPIELASSANAEAVATRARAIRRADAEPSGMGGMRVGSNLLPQPSEDQLPTGPVAALMSENRRRGQ